MARPEISVAMPVYNGAKYVEAAIRSVLDQDVDLDLVISDDLSKESTPEIIRSFSDPRVKVLENKDNRGIFGNLNRAISRSEGRLIQVFSQDDLMLPGFLRSQADMLDGREGAGLVYGGAIYIDEAGRQQPDGPPDTTPEVISRQTYLWISSHYGALPASISSIMFTRKAHDDVGGFDDSFKVAGDLEFYNRLSEHYGIVYNTKKLHAVRGHSLAASAVSSAGPAYLREEIRLAPWYQARMSQEAYREVISYRCATRGRSHLGWIFRLMRRGRLGEAVENLCLMNTLYPLTKTAVSLARASIAGPPHPSLRPPEA